MKKFLAYLPLIFLLIGCRTVDSVAPESPEAERIPAELPSLMEKEHPILTVNYPSVGEHLAIAQPLTVSGSLMPPPNEVVIVTVLVNVDGGTHPNFDFVEVDPVTGEWVVETHLHPKHIGDAELIIAFNSGPETAFDSGGSVSLPVIFEYDDTDRFSYVNLADPLSLTVEAKPGDEIVFQGTAHHPIDGGVWVRVLHEGETAPLFFEESVVGEDGSWEIAVAIPAEWAGESLLTEACTGEDDESGVAWCSSRYLLVE